MLLFPFPYPEERRTLNKGTIAISKKSMNFELSALDSALITKVLLPAIANI